MWIIAVVQQEVFRPVMASRRVSVSGCHTASCRFGLHERPELCTVLLDLPTHFGPRGRPLLCST